MVDPRKPVLRSTFVMPQTNTILDQHFATSVTHSGAVTTINGERLVPISTRSDGSKRTEKKIRTGYTPPEDIQKYRAPPLGPGLAGRRDSNAPACAHTDSWSQEKVLALAASLPIKHVSTRAPLPIGRQTTVVASDILNKISGLVNPEQRGLLAASSGFDDISTDAEGFRRTASKPRVTDAEPEPLSFEQPAEYPATTLEFTKASHRPEREVSGASADGSDGHLIAATRTSCRTDLGQHWKALLVHQRIKSTSLPLNRQVAPVPFTQPHNDLQESFINASERPDHNKVIQRRRPLWYTSDYVIGVKADKDYLKRSDTLRVTTYRPLSRPEHTPAIAGVERTNDFLDALKQKWYLAIQKTGGASDLSTAAHTGLELRHHEDAASRAAVSNAITSELNSHHGNPIVDVPQTPSSPIEVPEDDCNNGFIPPKTKGLGVHGTQKNVGSTMLGFSPLKSQGSARMIGQTSRLLQDSLGEIEYVKGHGIRRVDEDVDFEVELPSLNPDQDGSLEDENRFEQNSPYKHDDYFSVNSVLNVTEPKAIHSNRNLDLVWQSWDKKLIVRRAGAEVVTITVKDIISVAYTDDGQRLYLEIRPTGPKDCFCPDVLLTMSCDANDFTVLKHILISQMGGMKVNRKDRDFFFQRLRHLQQVIQSLAQKSVEEVPLSGRETENPEQDFRHSRAMTTEEATPKARERKKAYKEKDEEMLPKVFDKDYHRPIGDSTISNALTDDPSMPSSPEVSASTSPPKRLFYNSGQPVEKDDLVVRLRAKNEILGGNNKQDKFDIFDGPWQIAEIPSVEPALSVTGPPFGSDETEYLKDQTMDDIGNVKYQYFVYPKRMAGQTGFSLIPQLRIEQEEKDNPVMIEKPAANNVLQTLIKLQFPWGSNANPWTKLSRLIPVHEINNEDIEPPQGSDSREGSQVVGGHSIIQGTRAEWVAAAKLVIGSNSTEQAEDEVAGIVRLRDSSFVSVQYVTSEGPEGDGGYEVDKLRGKRLRLLRGAPAKGMRTQLSDPWVKRFIESGRWKMRKGEVLFTECRDDSWERGEDNIPETFVKEYEKKTDPFRDDDGSTQGMLDILDMLYEGDLQGMEATRKGKKARGVNRHRRGRPDTQTTTVDLKDHTEGEYGLHKAQSKKRNVQRRKRKSGPEHVSIIDSEDEEMGRPEKAAKSMRPSSARIGQLIHDSLLSDDVVMDED